MKTQDLASIKDVAFIKAVEEESGQTVSACYQCGKCTAGCPCGQFYDIPVSRIMRAIQLGDKKTVLSARSPWMCLSCSSCTVRCPNNIDVAKVMDTIRHIARYEGKKQFVINSFWDSFLRAVRYTGRSYELGIMALFMIRTGRLWSNVDLAPAMLKKQKLPFRPHFIHGKDAVARIFKRFDAMNNAVKSA